MNQIPSNDSDTTRSPQTLFPWFRQRWLWGIIVAAALAVILLLRFTSLLSHLGNLYAMLISRDQISAYVKSYGSAAPIVFMAMQLIQVVLAPIPGEATGFIGGFLFGMAGGTLYSTIALTLGSFINFMIGRLLGKKWVRKMIPSDKLSKMDYLLRHQALYIVFLLFLIPGFPKDYLCLFLGVSTMPMRVFLLMALIGRLPGTLMLSMNGALVFEQNYVTLSIVLAFSAIILALVYLYRHRLYKWVGKINGGGPDKIDE